MNRKSEQILKVDTAGRVWTPRELREAVLDEFERSGMPATQFAERIGVKYSTFAMWAHQRRKARGCGDAVRAQRGEAASLKWVEAVREDGRPSAAARALVVHLPGDARMEIKLLQEKIDALTRRLFGAQSEKLDPAQLLLMLQGLNERPKAEEPVEREAPRRSTAPSPPRERGPRWPTGLAVIETIIDPEPVKACPEAWRHIGDEVTEQLDYEPARFFKRLIIRRK